MLLKIFQLLAVLSSLCSGVNQETKAVKDDVSVLSCNYNISIEELVTGRIYWQKKTKTVLSIIQRERKVWPGYENRTDIDIMNNLSLKIRNLRLDDRGEYTCVVQKQVKGSYKIEHKTSVMLSVTAHFPEPNITVLETSSPNLRKLVCSTSGGFPEPHLSWLENEKELNARNTTISQDPETELYAVRSELSFNVTRNHSFTCLIKYGDLTVSQTFNWRRFKPEPPPENQLPSKSWTFATFSVGIPVIIAVITCCLFYSPTSICV
ncbi:T-lymphocyte activation antigen CD80 isoform X2 [Nycticebus coucang]|uniref:T-lymphocyte activation antigen CD80 isoform X2 n=1 Tax=Nycticebus coucang TaxID=9470 RepID=UPI00234CADE9|nr:T-lymphocyte activation antigen CD80 isoform X2 [Nycticebus coucang]